MTVIDERGLALTGATAEQAVTFNAVMRDYLDYKLSTFPGLKPLIAEAPEFAMAHLLKGYLMLSMGTRDTVPAALACFDHANSMVDSLTAREQLHTHALAAWARGDTVTACKYWDDILFSEPHDLLALKLQHFTLFWAGSSERMRDVVARILPAWDESTPGYAQVLGMYAFALEETNDYQQAERYGLEAAERHPDDLWAIHAVAHVYEMQGRLSDGIAWLERPLNHWDDRNPFRGHLWWHAAMFANDKGELDRALDLYDRAVQPAESTFYLDIQNTASLLARLEFSGVDVGDRWQALAEAAASRQNDHSLIFTEPHCAMVYGSTGQFEDADAQIESLRQFANDPDNSGARLVEPLVAPLCEAIGDFYKGDYAAAVSAMMQLRYDYQPIGGSHAQRDVFAVFLIDAAIRDGNTQLAKSLLDERVARHQNSYAAWKHYAGVCEQLGDGEAVVNARVQIERIAASA